MPPVILLRCLEGDGGIGARGVGGGGDVVVLGVPKLLWGLPFFMCGYSPGELPHERPIMSISDGIDDGEQRNPSFRVLVLMKALWVPDEGGRGPIVPRIEAITV